MSKLTLNIVTPTGSYGPISCDSVQLTVADNADGKAGGSYGIRKGHVKSLFALDKGSVKAYTDGTLVLKGTSGDGFASVDNDVVTVVVENYKE